MKQARIFLLLFSIIAALAVSAQRSGGTSRPLVLQFHHVIGDDSLALGNEYTNILGDTITIQKFRYYLSNFAVRKRWQSTRAAVTIFPGRRSRSFQ
jgi:hypothetical protein